MKASDLERPELGNDHTRRLSTGKYAVASSASQTFASVAPEFLFIKTVTNHISAVTASTL